MLRESSNAAQPRFDVHTHVGVDVGFYLRGWWPYACTARDLLRQMQANGIDRAVCFPFALPSAFDAGTFAESGRVELLPGRVPFDRENELLVDELDRMDGQPRLLPFAMFDPARCIEEQLRLLEKLVGRIAGLKTQPTVLESPVRALVDGGRELMAFAEQHNLPVLMHTALFAADEWSQVVDCLAVAAAYPKVRFNLAHSLRFHAAHLRAAGEMPNVWVDCAAHLAHCRLACEDDSPFVAAKSERVDADYAKPADLLAAVHEIMGQRYLWGSDNPFMSWSDDSINVVFSYGEEVAVLDALPDSVQDSMACTGPQEWLFGEMADV